METNITSANVAMETAKQVLNNVSNDKQNPDYKNIIQLIGCVILIVKKQMLYSEIE